MSRMGLFDIYSDIVFEYQLLLNLYDKYRGKYTVHCKKESRRK